MYNVQMPRRYTVATARARLADVLDEAERGRPVTIERRGVRFDVVARHPAARAHARRSVIEYVDPTILDGTWTWAFGRTGLKLETRRRKR